MSAGCSVPHCAAAAFKPAFHSFCPTAAAHGTDKLTLISCFCRSSSCLLERSHSSCVLAPCAASFCRTRSADVRNRRGPVLPPAWWLSHAASIAAESLAVGVAQQRQPRSCCWRCSLRSRSCAVVYRHPAGLAAQSREMHTAERQQHSCSGIFTAACTDKAVPTAVHKAHVGWPVPVGHPASQLPC